MIIPVIDIKDEKAVSGKLGKFGEYEELRSVVCKSSNPLDVARTYEELGFDEVYIADLDGILDSKPNLEIIERIVENTEISVMLDIGIWSKEMIILMEEVKPVIASETFCSLNLLEFPHEVVLCIDMRDGEIIAETCGELFTFIDLIKDSTKIQEIILLDLSRMGFSQGPNLELCKNVVPRLPDKKIIYGGGVRDLPDVYALEQLGVDRVLVGAALHSGSIFKDG